MKKLSIIGFLAVLMFTTGCAGLSARDNQNLAINTGIGTGVGAIAGVLIGGGKGAAIGSVLGGAFWAGNTPLEAHGGRTYIQSPYSPVIMGPPGPAYAPHGSYSYSSSTSNHKSSYRGGKSKSNSNYTNYNYNYSW